MLSRRRDEALEAVAEALCRGAVRKERAEDAADEDAFESMLCRWLLSMPAVDEDGEFE